ncbi:MAG: SGNH/GDSL hydrolase family protein [bacterium]|nr:SGNH/GDSL hydrolase family protein [bacterium]
MLRKIKNQSKLIIYTKSFLLALLIWLFAEQYIGCNSQSLKPGHYIEDPILFWKFAPGISHGENADKSYTINSYNMRANNDDISHPSIMMLGDSCTFGADVAQDKTIAAFLQRIINQKAHTDFKVYNAGCPGYSSLQSLNYFKLLAPKFKPDIVIIANLYGDAGGDYIKDIDRLPKAPMIFIKKLLWKSHIYKKMRTILIPQKKKTDEKAVPCRVSPQEYYSNVQGIIELGKKFNAKLFIITYYPRPYTPQDNFSNASYKEYAEKLRGGHTLLIDLFTEWKKQGRDTSGCFSDHMHPTGKGCELIAEDLAKTIMQREEFKELCHKTGHYLSEK